MEICVQNTDAPEASERLAVAPSRPCSGLAASGPAGTGLADTGLADTGGRDLDAGYRGSGDPGSGHPGSGHPGSGHPDSGHPDSGHPGSGHPGSGHPGSGHPDSGHPASGHPDSGETAAACGGARRRTVSNTHLVLIPSFNTGSLLAGTVAAARACWAPVWVVIDGSTDGSAAAIEAMARADPAVRLLRLSRNQGKGSAVRHGLTAALARGFTHALVMDADGQHPATSIQAFMAASAASPQALVMGRPLFGADAPWIRVVSRRLCNTCAAVMTGRRVGDTLFGFRVYPIAPLVAVMQASRGMRRFDFDPEAVVRLAWNGTPLIHLPTPVRYPSRAEGGISHFNYVRDNLLLTRMYLRLGLAAVRRLFDVAHRRGGDQPPC
jgi:Glycosyl transferase family 2